jgi:hypothetical protein
LLPRVTLEEKIKVTVNVGGLAIFTATLPKLVVCALTVKVWDTLVAAT